MSRIGKKLLTVPDGCSITFDKSKGEVSVKGKLGTLSTKLPLFVDLQNNEGVYNVTVANEKERSQKSMWGTARALVQNMLIGVSDGYAKEMELNGVGFKMEISGNTLVLALGFSHPVKVEIPSGIKLAVNKNVLSGTSIDKHLIGDFFTTLHDMKPCDPYKQKGFKFPGRFYVKKVGKKMSK
jgi:large subunit ribosomal protein L6